MKKLRHKTRSIWIDIIFSSTIILLTVTAILLILSSNKNHTASTPIVNEEEPTVASSIETEVIDSNYPGIKIVTKTSNDKKAPFAIQYPQSTIDSFNERVLNYVMNVQEEYKETMNNKSLLDENTKGELNISYETLAHSSGNYSFVLVNNSNFSDSPKGSTEIRTFHVNPETGDSYSISDLLEGDIDRLSQLSSLVIMEIQKDETLTGHLHLHEVELYTEPNWKNFQNYAITDDSLIFYFDENTIADDSVGPPIISISMVKTANLLMDAFKPQVEDIEIPKTETPIIDEKKEDSTDDTESDDPIEDGDSEESTETITNGKKVALTFDDGPDPKVTIQILNILEKHNAKATFFMLGSRVEYYPELTKEIFDAGHELAGHTWNHADLTKLTPERIAKEINDTSAIIEEVTGAKVKAYRPPYGAVNEKVRKQSDLPIILWDVDTRDWEHRNSQKLIQNVKQNTKDGSIILMHDIHQSTADGLDAILTFLEDEGYQFVTVSDL
ncbi:polysaccharide deacetylase family protein [Sporosarcina thermotolerans]|uniref:Polysaccharide deacetylase family protein n=1 Tax=Sporosarcina thermotolerans TaxID=633404 RepID=A0AAW9ABV0_9BACL|nr:polysaccharide deacetylase family protein [Sporosarcina thermotolerans]MDW0118430.1 polysaccharide deacetylase family protein [Sporosarcina thermotolerans]WHT47692.1 polysaccharide deacetylase family protein [Sporosarcina thermotolerans]